MKFSVITVCYNNRDGLEKTIKSVIGQTCKDYEFIVIDGGSKDGTKELLEQYDDQIDFWCSEPDKGIYNAMNKGVTHAHGDYVIFMNSGDAFYNKDVLDSIKKRNPDKDIISGYSIRIDNGGYYHNHSDNILRQLIYGAISHQATFIKRGLLVHFPYDETLKIVSDWKFWIQTIIANNVSFEFIDDKIAIQDMDGIASGDPHATRQKPEREIVLNEYIPIIIRNELQKYYTIIDSPFYKTLNSLKQKNYFLYRCIRKISTIIDKHL